MLRGSLISLAILLAMVSGCQSDRNPAPSMAESPSASEVVRKLDADVRAMAELSGAMRDQAEQAFGPRLHKDLELCRGTRYENKPLYLLAQWTMVHGDEHAPETVIRLVDRLEILPAPAFRNAGRALRVMALLRLGRVAEARPIAEQLEELVPEFGALRRVEFYDLVGQPAAAIPGLVVTGRSDFPADSFVLLAFIAMPDVVTESWLMPLKSAGGDRVRTIAVATAGDMLAAASAASWGVEVRWLRQGDPAMAGWRLPALPMTVLLGPGPNRAIVAVDVRPAQLAALSPKPH